MVNTIQAHVILREVKLFYKNELKSSNKTYDIKMPYDDIKTYEKQAIRNDKQAKVCYILDTYRSKLDKQAKSWFERGKLIGEQPRNSRIGNCEEMALLAGYYYVSDGHADPVWLGRVEGNGDHAFCLIGPKPAQSSTTPAMMSQYVDAASWVIDPWANISCAARDYYDEFMKKMAQWGNERKRIHFKGARLNPGEAPYLLGFAMAKLSFECMYQPLSEMSVATASKVETMEISDRN